MSDIALTVSINGEKHELTVPPHETLIECLRDRFGLLGVKKSCDVQVCGACTVLLDGAPVSSCLLLVGQVSGCSVTTVEGLSTGEDLHPLQRAFVEHGAVQCGFCIPGMIMSAAALLEENPNPTEEEIRWGIAGNLCRCTGYSKIVEAIAAASAQRA